MKLRKLTESEKDTLKITARRIGKLIFLFAIIKGIRWWMRENSGVIASKIDYIQNGTGLTLEKIIYNGTAYIFVLGAVSMIAGFAIWGFKFLEKKAFTVILFGFIIDIIFIRMFPEIVAAMARAVMGLH